MFDYKEYLKDLKKIEDEYIQEEQNEDDFEKIEEKYKKSKIELNKKYNIIYSQEDDFGIEFEKRIFIILDSKEKNIWVLWNNRYINSNDMHVLTPYITVSYDRIEKLKRVISTLPNSMYTDDELIPPYYCCDGDSCELFINDLVNDKQIIKDFGEELYWLEDEWYNSEKDFYIEKDSQIINAFYLIRLLKIIQPIQKEIGIIEEDEEDEEYE